MSDIWRELLDAAKSGGVISVELTPGSEIKKTKRKRGRPRVRGATPFGHYAGYQEAKGGRPKCALRGCGKYLKKTQRIACCAEHEAKSIAAAKALLSKLEEPQREAA